MGKYLYEPAFPRLRRPVLSGSSVDGGRGGPFDAACRTARKRVDKVGHPVAPVAACPQRDGLRSRPRSGRPRNHRPNLKRSCALKIILSGAHAGPEGVARTPPHEPGHLRWSELPARREHWISFTSL